MIACPSVKPMPNRATPSCRMRFSSSRSMNPSSKPCALTNSPKRFFLASSRYEVATLVPRSISH